MVWLAWKHEGVYTLAAPQTKESERAELCLWLRPVSSGLRALVRAVMGILLALILFCLCKIRFQNQFTSMQSARKNKRQYSFGFLVASYHWQSSVQHFPGSEKISNLL